MRACHRMERLQTSFDEPRLVTDAGLLLPATLAAQLGLKELLGQRVDWRAAPSLETGGAYRAIRKRPCGFESHRAHQS